MTSQLIPIFNSTINNESTLLCNARDLHKFLGVKRDFSTWINNRISEYGFAENLDYIVFSPKLGKTVGRPAREYHLTLDTAKELAMVERNEQGRKIRRYFIECEKQLHHILRQPPKRTAEPLTHKDMSNLKHMIYHMTSGMNFEGAWNAGIWYALRAATNIDLIRVSG